MAIKVSCIVSVYNGRSFIQGCLEDLVQQTLFERGEAEIVIIDSASPDNEAEIINTFTERYSNINYVRTPERETLYAAWNRGVGLATAPYVTNANADDRHRKDALEVLCRALDNNPSADLVYADVYKSFIANQMFDEIQNGVRLKYHTFAASDVILHYQFGCQPMWRKGVHADVGYFDPSMRAAGDWEFNFRFNLAGKKAHHVNEVLGVFYENPNSVSVVGNVSVTEQAMVRQKYLTFENLSRLLNIEGFDTVDPHKHSLAFCNLATRALKMELPWEEGRVFMDLSLAIALFDIASQLDPNNALAREGTLHCEKLKTHE